MFLHLSFDLRELHVFLLDLLLLSHELFFHLQVQVVPLAHLHQSSLLTTFLSFQGLLASFHDFSKMGLKLLFSFFLEGANCQLIFLLIGVSRNFRILHRVKLWFFCSLAVVIFVDLEAVIQKISLRNFWKLKSLVQGGSRYFLALIHRFIRAILSLI